MRKIADIDILSDEVLRGRMVACSLVFLAAGAAGCVFAFVAGSGDRLGPAWIAAYVLASLVALPAHELVHAAAFKLLVPGARVTFGFKDAFLYTSANGAVLMVAEIFREPGCTHVRDAEFGIVLLRED